MSNQVKFTATKLVNTGKKGILTPDSDGYYEMAIGGLNTFNSGGDYYTLKGAEHLFLASSIFMRRVANGNLKGELGHPKRLPGMSFDDYFGRIMTIEETNICTHFKEIYLDTQLGAKDPKLNNKELVGIMAKLKPTGAKAEALRTSLENQGENTCFSIRSLTKDYFQRGQKYKVLQTIYTWDHVTEPGIATANKWDSPGLESLTDFTVPRTAFERLVNHESVFANESSVEFAKECLAAIDNQNATFKVTEIPLFSKW